MRQNLLPTWVVYQMNLRGKFVGGNAVCEQTEWDAIESAAPGLHRFIQGGFGNEADAERLARLTPLPQAH